MAEAGGGSAVSGGGGGGGGGGNSTPKAWGQPTLLETEAGIAGAPAVAADRLNNSSNDGLVIAVWSQSDGVQDSIYATRYSGSWSSPVTIENESTGGFAGGAYSPASRWAIMARHWSYGDTPMAATGITSGLTAMTLVGRLRSGSMMILEKATPTARSSPMIPAA